MSLMEIVAAYNATERLMGDVLPLTRVAAFCMHGQTIWLPVYDDDGIYDDIGT